jgi:hypothetical protein
MVEQEEKKTEIVQLTDKYHSYRIGHGPQFNAGERVRVAVSEAETLVAGGAAVRISDAKIAEEEAAKALAHPIKDKMVKQAIQTK